MHYNCHSSTSMTFVQGLGWLVRVLGLGFRVVCQGFRFRVQGGQLGFQVQGFRAHCFPAFGLVVAAGCEFVSPVSAVLDENVRTSFVAILRRLGLLQSWVNIWGSQSRACQEYEETDSEENHPCKQGAQPPPPPPPPPPRPSEVKFEICCTSQVSDVAATIDTFRLFKILNPYL